VATVTLLEEPLEEPLGGGELAVVDGAVPLVLGPFEVRTVRVVRA
jgi:alpha-mannosidase